MTTDQPIPGREPSGIDAPIPSGRQPEAPILLEGRMPLPGIDAPVADLTRIILPQFKPGLLQRPLLWLSKTDNKAIAHCTPEALMGQTSLGAMVLLTGILALGSSFFTVLSIVQGVGVVLLVPFIYASAVMLFDRELVGFAPEQDDSILIKLKKMWPRLLFAMVLGYAIALPVELKVLERRIEAEIKTVVRERNSSKTERIADIRAEVAVGREALKLKVNTLQTELNNLIKQKNTEYDKGSSASGPGRGQRFEKFQEEISAQQKALDMAVAELQAGAGAGARNAASELLEKEINDEFESLRRDMLARVEALQRIKEGSPSAWWLANLIMVMFMLFELFPMVLKLFTRYNEYHAYLHARREINIQKAHVMGNYALADIAQNPRKALLTGEYTDRIQGFSEDSLGILPDQGQEPASGTPKRRDRAADNKPDIAGFDLTRD